MSPFKAAVNAAMLRLALNPAVVFVGQSVKWDGAAVYDSLAGVPMEQRVEMPVIEDFQLGYCTGLALAGKLPVSIFPRMDFLLLAANQLVNHLDKARGFGWLPKVIVRTAVGQRSPLDAGPQHTQDHTRALREMLTTVKVVEVSTPREVNDAYGAAFVSSFPTVVVENPGLVTVLANGCFDVLHAGHVRHLEAARAMGDRLVVALTVDVGVNKGAGFPVNGWSRRAEVLRSLRCVDEVVPSVTDVGAIMEVRPQVFVKGIDYTGSELLAAAMLACAEVGAELRITETEKMSSRAIVKTMRMYGCETDVVDPRTCERRPE